MNVKSLQTALETIEKIASLNNEDEKNKVLSDIYMIAHAFNGRCKNPHNDWKEVEAEMSEKLKDY